MNLKVAVATQQQPKKGTVCQWNLAAKSFLLHSLWFIVMLLLIEKKLKDTFLSGND